MMKKRVYAKLGRAGLGNELFPYLRAVDAHLDGDLHLVPPRWIQPRLGPWLRRERDLRNYWRLFRPPTCREFAHQLSLDVLYHFRNKWPLFKGAGSSTLIITGMEQYFQSLKRPGPWYREFLAAQLRKGMLSPQFEQDYLSVHVRLGDFARPATDTNKLVQNNVGTPLEWYAEIIRFVKAANLNLAIVLSSDGSDDELAPLLRLPGVERTTARNALDELFIMSRSRGIVGSRSTFSSWGAFLGATPLLLIEGGNAYPPHADVWEDTSDRERKAWLAAVLTGSQSTKTRS